jgi:hypothetical protein
MGAYLLVVLLASSENHHGVILHNACLKSQDKIKKGKKPVFGFFKVVPSILVVCSVLPLVVFFAQFCPSSAIEQKGKTEQKTLLRVKLSTPPKLRALS